MRTASFAMLFVATSLHVSVMDFGPGGWLLLVALFLIYPHLQYWRACRADDSVRAEMQNLVVDSVLLGMYIAALAFSQWLAFAAVLGTLSNNAANKGWKGVWETAFALLGGILVWVAVMGFNFSPQTEWPATIFCMLGLGSYLLAMQQIGYSRNLQLRQTRESLRLREQEMLAANQTLQRHLREIDALQVQLREQATRDPLTGLHNRGSLDGALERESARCKREGEALSLVMIDVDSFKNYNDRYGHQSGDECLKNVARTLQACARRASDLVARYGGEEFSLVLPNTDTVAAAQLAETIRCSIEALDIPHVHSPVGRVTISIGVATMSGGAETDVASLLRGADEALYRAKEGGRNQVCVAPAIPLPGAGLASFVQLVWHEAYECNNPLIDDQHRALFAQANGLLGAMLAGQQSDEVNRMLDTLIQDVVQHFRDEEAIITAAGVPGLAEHLDTHHELVDRVVSMRDAFRAGVLGIGELFQFIAHDLVARHMLGADRKLFPYLTVNR